MYWHIPAIKFGKRYMRNFNTLIGRYEGADGMKTGFICASGFNLVATATRDGKRLIAVVLGAPSSPYARRESRAACSNGALAAGRLSWLSPSLGTVDSLQPINATPPDLRDEMCGPHRKRPAAEEADDESDGGFLLSSLPNSDVKPSTLLKDRPETMKTITVFIGAAKNAAEAQFSAVRAKLAKIRGKKAPVAATPASVSTTTTGGTSTLKTVAAPASGSFKPATAQTGNTRLLPTATDASSSAMSFTSPAKADPAPLTAMPEAKTVPAATKTKSAAKTPAAMATGKTTTATKPPATAAKSKKDEKSAAKKGGKKPDQSGLKTGTKSAATSSTTTKQ